MYHSQLLLNISNNYWANLKKKVSADLGYTSAAHVHKFRPIFRYLASLFLAF